MLGVMLDCSRNAVRTVKTIKSFIDKLCVMGYDNLQLYTEDTYCIQGEPFFGAYRGGYSMDELRQIDSYAQSKGIELVPCIQTLAHLNTIFRWKPYKDLRDVNDILNVGDERVYELIEKMFAACSMCFSSRRIHIGMDEAHLLGLGEYLNKFGYRDRVGILIDHLGRVCQIARKYGFSPMMWGDMFFRLAFGENYAEYVQAEKIREVRQLIPSDVSLVYWDYYSKNPAHYERMLQNYTALCDRVVFAGGAWTWTGFVPHNGFSLSTMAAAMPAVAKQGINNVFFTVWGDNGAECSPFSVLPALFVGAEYYRGNYDMCSIKNKFRELFGISFDAMMLLDLPNAVGIKRGHTLVNPSKYLLYNDLFLGIFDNTVDGTYKKDYQNISKKLQSASADASEYKYIFDFFARLCDTLALKSDLGKRTRAAYRCGKSELSPLVGEYKKLISLYKKLYASFCALWEIENKPFGFEVQDIRFGGLIKRAEHCLDTLCRYISGGMDSIQELEADTLPVTWGHEVEGESCLYNDWAGSTTACPV